jgi:hypothetical protein
MRIKGPERIIPLILDPLPCLLEMTPLLYMLFVQGWKNIKSHPRTREGRSIHGTIHPAQGLYKN